MLPNYYLDARGNQMPGHVELDKGLVDLLEHQEVHHLVRGVGCLIQIVVPEGLQRLAVRSSCAIDIV